jgi:hypothetical protein
MTPVLKAIVIILIASAVVVPTGVYAYRMSQNPGTDMASFIPAGSVFAMSYTNNSTTYYAFADNNSAALIAPVSLSSLASDYSSGNTNTSVSGVLHYFKIGVNMTVNTTFRGYTIFQIGLNETFNLSGIEKNLTSRFSGYSKFMNYSNYDLNHTFTTSLFATQLSSGNVEIGGIGAIESSITAHSTGTDILKQSDNYFQTGANLSLYANFTNPAFRTVSLNVFENHTNMNVTFSNQSSEGNFSALLGLVEYSNSSLISHEVKGNDYIFVQIALGMQNLTETQKLGNDN